jgi:polyisoprenoid-binding protein YceI
MQVPELPVKEIAMKRFATVLMALMMSAAAGWAADTYKVDPVHTSVVFRAGHAGVGAVYGVFKEASGTFTLDEADLSKSSFNFEVAAGSVDSRVEKRDAHLKSPDFLNAKQYPEITFKSTSVKKIDDKHLEVTGDLTLHGVTKSITVPVELLGKGEFPQGTPRAGLETIVALKTSDYQIKGLPGLVSDEIKLMIAVEGTR